MKKFKFEKEIDVNRIYSNKLMVSDDFTSVIMANHVFSYDAVNKHNVIKINDLLSDNLLSLNILNYKSDDDFFYRKSLDGYTLSELISSRKYNFSTEILLRILIIFCNLIIKIGISKFKLPYITSEQILISKEGKIVFQTGISYALLITALKDELMYISPEFIKDGSYDEKSLVYSIGVILYKSVLSKNPFTYKDYNNLIDKILDDTPTLPSLHDFNLDSEMEKIILKCLEKDPNNRYESIFELVKAIKTFYDSTYRADPLKINIGVSFDENKVEEALIPDLDNLESVIVDTEISFLNSNYYWLLDITNDWISSEYKDVDELLASFDEPKSKVNGVGILDEQYVLFVFDNKIVSVNNLSNGSLVKELGFIKKLSNVEFRVPQQKSQTLPLSLLNMLTGNKFNESYDAKESFELPENFTGYVTGYVKGNISAERRVINLIDNPLLDLYLTSSYKNEYNILKPNKTENLAKILANSFFEIVLLDMDSIKKLDLTVIAENRNVKFIIFDKNVTDEYKQENTICINKDNLNDIIDVFKKIFPLGNKRHLSKVFVSLFYQSGKPLESLFFTKDNYLFSSNTIAYKDLQDLDIIDVKPISNTFFDYDSYSKTKESIVSLVKESFEKPTTSTFSIPYEDDEDDKTIYLSYNDYSNYTLDKLLSNDFIYSQELRSKFIDNIIIPPKSYTNESIFVDWLIKDFLFLLVEKNQLKAFELIADKIPQISKIEIDKNIELSGSNSVEIPVVIYFAGQVAIMVYGGGDLEEIKAIEAIYTKLINKSEVNLVSVFYLSNTKYSNDTIKAYKHMTKQVSSFTLLTKMPHTKGVVKLNNCSFHFVLLSLDSDDNVSIFLPEL